MASFELYEGMKRVYSHYEYTLPHPLTHPFELLSAIECVYEMFGFCWVMDYALSFTYNVAR